MSTSRSCDSTRVKWATLVLWATKFGKPWGGAALDVSVQPPALANNPGPPAPPPNEPPPVAGTNYATWLSSTPEGIVTLSAPLLTTGADGTCVLSLTAGDPGTPRTYRDGCQQGPGGQVYFVSGSWLNWGPIFLFSGAPINLLVFSKYPLPANSNVGR